MCEKKKRILSLDSSKNRKKKKDDIIEKFGENYDALKGFNGVVNCGEKIFVKFWYLYMEKLIQYNNVSPLTKNAYDYLNDNKSKEFENSLSQLWSQEFDKLLKKNCNGLKEKDPKIYNYLLQLSKKPYLSKIFTYGMDSQNIQTSIKKSQARKELTMNFDRVNLLMEYCYQNNNLLLFFLAPFLLNSLASSLSFIPEENVQNTKTLVMKPFILPFSLDPYPTDVLITLEDLNTVIQCSLKLCVTYSQQVSILDQHIKNLTSSLQKQNEAKLGLVLCFLKSFTFFQDQLYQSNEILMSLTEVQNAVIAVVANLTKIPLLNEDFYNAIYKIIKKLFYFLFDQSTMASSFPQQEKEILSASGCHMTFNTFQKFVSQDLAPQLLLKGKISSHKQTPIGDLNKNEFILFSFYRLLVDICPSQKRKLQKTEKSQILAVFETVRLFYWRVDTQIRRRFLFFLIQHFGHFIQAKANQGTATNVSIKDIKLDSKDLQTIDLLTLSNWKLIYTANLIVKLLIEKKHESDLTFAFCFSTMLLACIELLSHQFKFYPCVEHLLQLQFVLMTVFESYTPIGSCLVRLGYALVNENERNKRTKTFPLTSGLDLDKKMKERKLFVLKEKNPISIRIESKPLILWIPHTQLTQASLSLYTQSWIQLCNYYMSLISKHFSFPDVTVPLVFNFKKLIRNPNCIMRKQLKQCIKFVQDNTNRVELKKKSVSEDCFQINSNCSIFMSP